MLRLLGGLVLFVVTSYYGPKLRTGKERGEDGSGLYPELAAFGFSKGTSPALVSTVSRLSALMPSFECAKQEMDRRGVDLDVKSVRRISERLGTEFLATRTHDLLAWRAGELPAGTELAGKRVAVAIDGGRVRLRENRRPQRRKGKRVTRRRRYKAQWREPKLVTIFEVDQRGRMKPGTRASIDGTFAGPDHLMELVAFHLHRLGAGQAEVVAFVCDGAPWIWDRLDWVRQRIGMPPQQTEYILDWCHAVHHVSIALEHLTLADTVRREVFRRLRRDLRAGRVQQVVDDLKRRARGTKDEQIVRREIRFLEKHKLHMRYKHLRRIGLPMGSGAVESAIRRVVNQRLKGNGIMWLQENAEAMLVLRAAALTDRWEESIDHARNTLAGNRRLDWAWLAPDIPSELHGKPPPPKPPRKPRSCAPQALEKTGVMALGR